MKIKKLLFLTIMLFTASLVYGQTYLTEGFETSVPPSGWLQYQSTGSNSWAQTTSRVHAGTYSAYFNDFSGDNDVWLITSSIDLSTSTSPQLTYWDNVDYSGSADQHNVKISTDYTGSGDPSLATWTLLNGVIGTEDTWVENGPYSLSAYKVSGVYIAWQYVGNYASDWYIDDVLVDEGPVGPGAPTSPSPTNGATSIAINNNPDISWTNPAGTVYNEVYFSTTEADVTNKVVGARVLNGSPGTFYTSYNQVADLAYNTTYYWRVLETDATGTTDGSVWSFTTVYQPTTVPWTEGFEGIAAAGDWPGGWDHDGDWDTYTSSTTYNRQPRTGSNFASCKYSADDWAYSCPITLEASKTYNFSVWYITDGNSGWTTLEVKYGTGQTSGDMTNAICSVSSPTNTTYQELTGSFSPASDGTYYIGIHVEATSSPWYITIDDLSLAETVPKDIAVNSASIALPANVWCYFQGGSYTVSAVIENKGTETDPTSVTLTYK